MLRSILVTTLICGGLCGCHALLSDNGGGTVPEPVPTPVGPAIEVPEALQQQVDAALLGRHKEARKYAALYQVMAEEIRTTDRTLSQIRRDLPGAKPKLGLPSEGVLAEVTATHFEPWSQGAEFTDESRESFARACEVLSAACLQASQ